MDYTHEVVSEGVSLGAEVERVRNDVMRRAEVTEEGAAAVRLRRDTGRCSRCGETNQDVGKRGELEWRGWRRILLS